MNICIKNLKYEKPQYAWQVKVDRSSILGNPFHMANESQRKYVCEQYEEYFYETMKQEGCAFYNRVMELIEIAKKYGKLELFCWCAPRRCHAQTIKKYIEEHVSVFDYSELIEEARDIITERIAIYGTL